MDTHGNHTVLKLLTGNNFSFSKGLLHAEGGNHKNIKTMEKLSNVCKILSHAFLSIITPTSLKANGKVIND